MSAVFVHQEITAQRLDWLAGAPGFEPGDGGIKIRCLTTWLRPNLVAHDPFRKPVPTFRDHATEPESTAPKHSSARGARTIAARSRPINARRRSLYMWVYKGFARPL